MVIQHNLISANAERMLNIENNKLKKSTEKLSSGYRINRAADDAAGLAISEKLRWQKRGLSRASANAGDAVSFIQTSEGALAETSSMLDRMKELMTQAANDTNTPADRQQIQEEIDQLSLELDRVSSTTKFNTLDCFSKDGLKPSSITNSSISLPDLTKNPDGTFSALVGSVEVVYSFINSDGNKVDSVTGTPSGAGQNTLSADEQKLADEVVQASSFAVGKLQQYYPSLFKGSTSGIKVGLDFTWSDGASKTLASASYYSIFDGTNTVISYKMNVDLVDYKPTNYDSNSLRTTVAHEMTHLVMFDALTANMVKDGFPTWFVEGIAQTTSGDGGWFNLNGVSSDKDIQNYAANLDNSPYGSGYLATMYLGYAASGSNTVNSASIRSGLDKILGDLVDGKAFSDAIRDNTKYSSLDDFASQVKSGSSDILSFTKDFIAERGNFGSGSILGEISQPDIVIFGNLSAASSNNYTIDPTHQSFANAVLGSVGNVPQPGQPANPGGGTTPTPPSAPTSPTNPGTGTAAANTMDMWIQVGGLGGQGINMRRFDVSAEALLGTQPLDTSSYASCARGMDQVERAIERTSAVRAFYGAVQNRLEYTIRSLDNVAENTDAAESRIRDADMAKESVNYQALSILQQSGQAMIVQANQTPQSVLKLLQ